ncbi:carboxymuconolactone decarboxylase family protein [Dinghuibacter silviterrae]|uniref:AhpD family alkylhydroperoxidase n=1 Tax=Dinghuibacter silviterrae TaxID=1539049 RepID=A0A4V3GLF2_9BACT|nr:carboxymuconolactone decarboxylase family protein [Dinghuibacter silviterrae]TDW99242.1 AhpD family alkylhydroperoxidase [Dinghuibacter silviterrae]
MFKVPSYEEVTPEAQATFDQLKRAAGKVPNLYATIGYSANALGSYMAFVQAQAKGSFHGKDREGVYLIVSEINGCEYCLASHTLSAIRNHWTEEETLQLRAGTLPDPRWKAIYAIVRSVIEHRGEVAEATLRTFFDTGFSEANLMDLMVLINVMSFTNYVYRMTRIPLDFPPAKPLV